MKQLFLILFTLVSLCYRGEGSVTGYRDLKPVGSKFNILTLSIATIDTLLIDSAIINWKFYREESWNRRIDTTVIAVNSDTGSILVKRYWGRCNGVPGFTEIKAADGGGSDLSSRRAKGTFTISAKGSHNIYFAYPAFLGPLTTLSIGGIYSLEVFTQNTVSFTGASGRMQKYFVYVSQNTYSGDAINIITE